MKTRSAALATGVAFCCAVGLWALPKFSTATSAVLAEAIAPGDNANTVAPSHFPSTRSTLASDAEAELLAQAQADWWATYNAIRQQNPNQGVIEEGVLYAWQGPTPITIKMIVLATVNGKQVLAPDPVEYGELRSSASWLNTHERASPADLPGPDNCNAKLVKAPPPNLGMDFVCDPRCGSNISCEASVHTPVNQGYCSCDGGPAPAYCHGTFTTTGSSGLNWTIDCSGSCDTSLKASPNIQCKIYTVTDNGWEVHWCKC